MILLGLLLLVTQARGDISEKLRQGQGLTAGGRSDFPGLQPPLFGGGVKGGSVKGGFVSPRATGATNSGGRIVIPSHHHDDNDEDNLDRLCNDPFHSFLCKPVGPRKHRFDGKLRPGAQIPDGVLSGASSNVRESKEPPSNEGGALLSTGVADDGYRYPKPSNNHESQQPGYQYPKPTNVYESKLQTPQTGYQYPKPTNIFESKLPAQQEGYTYPKPTNTFVNKLPPLQQGYTYPKPSPTNQLILPQQTIQNDVKIPQGYRYDKPAVQLAYPSQQITTKAPLRPSNEYLPSFGSPAPKPDIDIRFGLPLNTPFVQQPTTTAISRQEFIQKPSFSSNNNVLLGKSTNNNPQQIFYSYPKPSTQFPIIPQPTVPVPTVNKINFISKPSTFAPYKTPSTTQAPLRFNFQSTFNTVHPANNNYLPPSSSPIANPSDNIKIKVPVQTTTQAPTSRPVPSNEYLPSFNSPIPKPSDDVRFSLPFIQPNQGYQYPNPTNQLPVKIKPAQEYLPSDDGRIAGESTNLEPNIEGGAILSAGQDPSQKSGQRKHERTHTLEELCNDAFHSFLCKPIVKERKRIDGRIRPGAKIPPHVLLGEGTSNNGARRLPPNEEGSSILAPQIEHVIPGYEYRIPQTSFQSTNIMPQIIPLLNQFQNPFFIGAASDTSTLAKTFIKPTYTTTPTTTGTPISKTHLITTTTPRADSTTVITTTAAPTTRPVPITTRATTTTSPRPSTTFQTLSTTSRAPSTTAQITNEAPKEFNIQPAGSSQTENKGYFYPKPSDTFTYPTKKPQGYFYSKPPPGLEFNLPTKPPKRTTAPPFGTRLFKPYEGQSQVQEEIPFPVLNNQVKSYDSSNSKSDSDLPPASQFEILKP